MLTSLAAFILVAPPPMLDWGDLDDTEGGVSYCLARSQRTTTLLCLLSGAGFASAYHAVFASGRGRRLTISTLFDYTNTDKYDASGEVTRYPGHLKTVQARLRRDGYVAVAPLWSRGPEADEPEDGGPAEAGSPAPPEPGPEGRPAAPVLSPAYDLRVDAQTLVFYRAGQPFVRVPSNTQYLDGKAGSTPCEPHDMCAVSEPDRVLTWSVYAVTEELLVLLLSYKHPDWVHRHGEVHLVSIRTGPLVSCRTHGDTLATCSSPTARRPPRRSPREPSSRGGMTP